MFEMLFIKIYFLLKTSETSNYIETLLNIVKSVYFRMTKAKANIENLYKMIYDWAMLPVIQRKEMKAENLLAINERKEKFAKRYSNIAKAAKEINNILEENYKLYFNLLPESFYIQDEFEVTGNESKLEDATEDDANQNEEDIEFRYV